MANVDSLRNKLIDITTDIQANASHHICVVETWLERNKEYNLNIPGRYVLIGFVKRCQILIFS